MLEHNYIYICQTFDGYRKMRELTFYLGNKSAGAIFGTFLCRFHISTTLSELNVPLPGAEGGESAHHSLLFMCPCPPWFHRPCCPAINLVKEGKGDRSKGGGSAHGGSYGRLHILQYYSQYTDNQGFLKMLFGYDFNFALI